MHDRQVMASYQMAPSPMIWLGVRWLPRVTPRCPKWRWVISPMAPKGAAEAAEIARRHPRSEDAFQNHRDRTQAIDGRPWSATAGNISRERARPLMVMGGRAASGERRHTIASTIPAMMFSRYATTDVVVDVLRFAAPIAQREPLLGGTCEGETFARASPLLTLLLARSPKKLLSLPEEQRRSAICRDRHDSQHMAKHRSRAVGTCCPCQAVEHPDLRRASAGESLPRYSGGGNCRTENPKASTGVLAVDMTRFIVNEMSDPKSGSLLPSREQRWPWHG